MSKTYKSLVYKKRDGHRHAFNCEEERIEDLFRYYMTFEDEEDI